MFLELTWVSLEVGVWGDGLSGREENSRGCEGSDGGEEVLESGENTGVLDIPLVNDFPLLVSLDIHLWVNVNQ